MPGLITGLVFFGTTSVVGAQSFNVIFTIIFPDYMSWGDGFNNLGLDFPAMLSYIIIWAVTVLLFLPGMKILGKKRLDLSNKIYLKSGKDGGYKGGYNRIAVIVLIISFLIPMSGVLFTNVPLLVTLKDFAFFSGLIISFVLYTLLYKETNENT
ncbi:hypothetical protein YSY43_12500 [Paenibacillus sp. YSY-4.3]